MAKQLNVNLSFTADTEKAKAQIRELQNALTKITQNASKTSPLGLTEDVNSAIKKVTELQTILQKATTETGSLDLGQFNQELKKANLSAETIKSSLAALGPEGQAAFAKIAQSVSMAEIPLKRTNGLLAEFATTLKNTARWQLSSSILHGFIGSVQSAYRYAQDLNSSLNDIRIVTGQSTEQMAEFAKQANESAKALSATTTAYTDAALIFYQQGLGDEAVKERTDTVIKMSNVTGEAVKDVSSYMTAIWNNFDDGSQSLEHYADVITALGAATASSSEEIAGGLEKFASIGKTVGLSYDYATAALATVVSATRQSEDVVGNAFKTIFSRIQGLKLGETLEDDVDLNKYSAALKAVGVEVVTSSGQLRDLDNILDDLASKWDNLTSAQQTALAQTVAGTRQYAQFIALMGNWDSMTRNLEIARGAEGSLQEQANIYAESWEAARKRVKASAQAIYDDLLDDQFFIKLTDAVSKVLDGIHSVIESIGGLKGVIPIISSLLLKMFGGDIVNSMNNFMYNIQLMSNKGRQAIIDRRKEFNEALVSMKIDMEDLPSIGDLYQKQGESQNQLIEKTVELQQKGKELTEQEQLLLQAYNDQTNALIEQAHQKEVLRQQTQVELVEEEVTTAQTVGRKAYNSLGYKNEIEWTEGLHEATRNQQALEMLKKTIFEIKQVSKDGIIDKGAKDSLKTILEQTKLVDTEFEKLPPSIKKIYNELEKLATEEESADINLEELSRTVNRLSKNSNFVPTLEAIKNSLIKAGTATKEEIKYIDDLINTTKKLSSDTLDSAKSFNSASKSIDNLNEQYNKLKGTTIETSQAIVTMGQGISSFAMYLNSIHSLINGITNPDLSGIERLTTIMMSLGMVINGFTSTAKSLGTIVNWLNGLFNISILNQQKKIALTKAETIQVSKNTSKEVEYYGVQKLKNLEDGKSVTVNGKVISAEELRELTTKELTAAIHNMNKEELEHIGIMGAETAGLKGVTFANENLKASLLSNPYGWILLAIGAIVAGLSLWISYEKKLRDKQVESNKAEIERIKALQEETKANQELIKKYNELYEAYNELNDKEKDNFENKEQLGEITDQLAEKYNLEGAALAKLTGHYDSFTESLRNAQLAELEASEQDLSLEKELYEKTYRLENSSLYTIPGMVPIENEKNSKEEELKISQLSKDWLTGVEGIDINDVEAFKSWKEGIQQLVVGQLVGDIEATTELYDKLLEVLNFAKENYDGDFTKTEEYSKIIKFINESKEAVEEYKKIQQSLEETIAQKIIKSFNTNEIDSLNKYEITLEKVTEALKGENIEQERAKELAEKFLPQENAQLEKFQQEKQLISDLTKEWNLLNEEKIKELVLSGKYSNEDFGILLSFGIDPSSIETLENELDLLQKGFQGNDWSNFNTQKDLSSALSGYKNKKFSEEDLSVLFGNENYGLTQEEFSGMDENEQLIRITNDYIQYTKEVVDSRDQIISSIENEIVKLEELEATEAEAGAKSHDELKRRIEDYAENAEEVEELYNIIKKYGLDQNSLSEDEEKKLNNFLRFQNREQNKSDNFLDFKSNKTKKESLLFSEEDLVKLSQSAVIYDDYADKISILKYQLEEARETEKSYFKVVEATKDLLVAYNKEMDEIQTTYKSLNEMVTKYNETGTWTIDNVQSLIEMDDKYVATLDFTEDKLKLNISAFQAMTLATLDELEASVDLEFQQKMLAIKEQELEYAAAAAGAAAVVAGSQMLGMGNDALTAADGVQLLNETLEALDNLGGDNKKWKDLAEQTEKAWEARKKAIKESREEVLKGGTAFDDVMKTGKEKSSKSKDLKDLKKYLDEFDHFYPIKKAIEDVSDALSDLSKKQQHLAGKALANSLKEQNKLLQNQAELYKELLTEQEDYRNELAGTLSSFGMTFDAATGNITNYAAATQSALDKYNQAIITYNASAQDEVAKATLKTAEEEYNVFKNTLSKYQSILKDIESTTNNLDDIFYKQIENNFKAFEVEIKLDLDIEDARRKVLDFIQEINTDFKKVYKTTAEWTKLFDVAAKKVETFTEQEGTLSTDLKELKQIADIIDDPNYNYGSSDALFASKSDAINKYKEITETLMSDSKELYNLYESSWQNYLSAVDEVKDQWNNVIKDFEKINKTLDHYSKLIELLYGGEETVAGRNYLDELYGAQVNNSLAKQTALKEEILALQKEYDEILATGTDQNDEDVKRIAEAIEDANDELNSEIEDYLDTIQKKLTNSIKSIMDTADRAMTQDVGINKVIERWNDAKEAAEGYYDETERIYQLQKAENSWKDLISSTSRIKDQQYLKQIMDSQLKNLKEKTKLSEYDIALAEKELEVQKAYIALQNAQNNKNSMKLVRNQQGNWTYQYVADQNEVLDKQQDFLDALNQKYEFVKEKSAETTEKVMNLYQTANEKLTALLQEYTTADETRRAEIKEEYDYFYEYYYGSEGVIVQAAKECADIQNDVTSTMMQLLEGHYEVNEKNFEEMTSEQQRLVEELKDTGISNFGELSLALGDKESGIYGDIYQHAEEALNAQNTDWQNLAQNIIDSWGEDPDKNVRDVIRDSYDQIMDKVKEYDGAIKASEEASGIAWGNIKIDIDETTRSLDTLIQKTDALSNFRTHVDAIGTAWLNVKSGIEAAVSALNRYLELLKQDTGQPVTPDYSTSTVGTSNSNASSGGNSNNGGSNGDNRNTLKDIKSTKTKWQICELGTSTPHGSYDSYEDAVKACQNEGYFSYASGNICYYNKTNKNTAGASGGGYNYNNNRTKNVMMAYATGGYTGDWNSSEGRIGVLHEKELVLNKEDTSNILNAVNLVRGISNIGSLVSSAISSNLAGMALSLTGLGSNTINRNVSTNNSSNNVFNINAEFPNAENVEEIREAILSLPNLAAQYLAQK